MHHFAACLQESVRELEAHDQVLAVQRRFDQSGQDLARPGRTVLREGDLVKLSRSKREQHYRFFLFNDLLVYASKRMGGLLKVRSFLLFVVRGVCGFAFRLSSSLGGQNYLSLSPFAYPVPALDRPLPPPTLPTGDKSDMPVRCMYL